MKHGKLMIACWGTILVLAGLAWGQDSLNITKLGQYCYWGMTYDVAVQGSYAYVAEENGLRIMDVSDSTHPVEVACSTPAYSLSVAVNGFYVYVGGYGLKIVDITHPVNPHVVSSYAPNTMISHLDLHYPLIYLAEDYNGFSIVDVSNPSSPVEICHYPLHEIAQGLMVVDSLLYLANGYGGLQIFNVSNPAAPTRVGVFMTPNYARDVYVVDTLAYVLDGSGYEGWGEGLMILDVSNPTAPTYLGHCGGFVEASDVKVQGNFAYVAIPWRGLRIIDVSNPHAPTQVLIYQDDLQACNLALAGSLMYTAGDGLKISSLSNPAAPVLISSYYVSTGARKLAVDGHYAYAVNCQNGLDILDVSVPTHPNWITTLTLGSYPWDVAISYPYAYVACQDSGMYIVDVSNPRAPRVVSNCRPAGTAEDVAVHSHFAYLACGSGGLAVISIYDPAAPFVINVLTSVRPRVVTVSGSYLYTGEDQYTTFQGLRVFSLANPLLPVQVGSVSFTGQLYQIGVTDSLACVAGSLGLRIVNISNPAAPSLAYTSNSYRAWDLDVQGSLLYLAPQFSYNLEVLNLSNPAIPVEVGFYGSNGTQGIDVVDSIVYTGEDYRLATYNVSDCNVPVGVVLTPYSSSIQIPANGGSFQYYVNLVNFQGLPQTLDIWMMVRLPNQHWYGPVLGPLTLSLPGGATLTRLRTQSVPGSAPSGYYTYEARVGDYPNLWGCDNFEFHKMTTSDGNEITGWNNTGEPFPGEETISPQPTAFSLQPCFPNPFNPSTAISYQLSAGSQVRLTIYDTAGRLVSTLVDGMREAGTHEVTFDGSRLASGIYLAKLKAGNFIAVQKLVLIK